MVSCPGPGWLGGAGPEGPDQMGPDHEPRHGGTALLRRRLLASGLAAATLLPALPGMAQSDATPAFVGTDGWMNAEAPLTIGGPRGKAVLVEFWSYSRINCRRTVPSLNR